MKEKALGSSWAFLGLGWAFKPVHWSYLLVSAALLLVPAPAAAVRTSSSSVLAAAVLCLCCPGPLQSFQVECACRPASSGTLGHSGQTHVCWRVAGTGGGTAQWPPPEDTRLSSACVPVCML